LDAVIWSGKFSAVAGFPVSVAVPFPLLVNVTPLGRAPDSVIELAVGVPVVVTVKVVVWPFGKVALLADVMVGATAGLMRKDDEKAVDEASPKLVL
jgi:hypothetical protein